MKSKLLHVCTIALASTVFVNASEPSLPGGGQNYSSGQDSPYDSSEISELETRISALAAQISALQLDQSILNSTKTAQENFLALLGAIQDSDAISAQLKAIKDNKIAVAILMQKLSDGELIAQKSFAAQITAAQATQTATESEIASQRAAYTATTADISALTASDGDVTKLRATFGRTSADLEVLRGKISALETKIAAVIAGTATAEEVTALATAVGELSTSVAALKSALVKKADKSLVTPLNATLNTRASAADFSAVSTKVDKILAQKLDQATIHSAESALMTQLDALEDSLTKILNEKSKAASSGASTDTSNLEALQRELDKAKVALASQTTDVSILTKNVANTDAEKASVSATNALKNQVQIQLATKADASTLATVGSGLGTLTGDFGATKAQFEAINAQMTALSAQLDEFGESKVSTAAFAKVVAQQPQIQSDLSGLQDGAGKNADDLNRIEATYDSLTEGLKTLWTSMGTLGDEATAHLAALAITLERALVSDSDATSTIATLTEAIEEAKAGIESGEGEEQSVDIPHFAAISETLIDEMYPKGPPVMDWSTFAENADKFINLHSDDELLNFLDKDNPLLLSLYNALRHSDIYQQNEETDFESWKSKAISSYNLHGFLLLIAGIRDKIQFEENEKLSAAKYIQNYAKYVANLMQYVANLMQFNKQFNADKDILRDYLYDHYSMEEKLSPGEKWAEDEEPRYGGRLLGGLIKLEENDIVNYKVRFFIFSNITNNGSGYVISNATEYTENGGDISSLNDWRTFAITQRNNNAHLSITDGIGLMSTLASLLKNDTISIMNIAEGRNLLKLLQDIAKDVIWQYNQEHEDKIFTNYSLDTDFGLWTSTSIFDSYTSTSIFDSSYISPDSLSASTEHQFCYQDVNGYSFLSGINKLMHIDDSEAKKFLNEEVYYEVYYEYNGCGGLFKCVEGDGRRGNIAFISDTPSSGNSVTDWINMFKTSTYYEDGNFTSANNAARALITLITRLGDKTIDPSTLSDADAVSIVHFMQKAASDWVAQFLANDGYEEW